MSPPTRALPALPAGARRVSSLASPLGRLSLLLAAALPAAALIFLGLLPCPVAFALRIPCPGCGMTRATLALLRGDLAGMFRLHPLAPLVLLFLGGYLGGNALGFVLRGRWGWVDERLGRRSNALLWAFVALVLGVWILRFAGLLGGPVPVLAMHDELLATLLSWVVGSTTTGLLLRWDRRRLGPVGRRRMWHDATLYLAVSGLFLPAPLTFGAHLWVTRPGPLGRRIALALAGSVGALTLSVSVTYLMLLLLGFE